ncbi:MAG: serine/threonine-protein phosphatase [Desulfobacteraceae bacterium]|nr:MAG: serine/threonine-protein phosphatase [Desulfobacteraceae bacterium]
MVTVESAGLTDVGRRREANEDRILLDDALGLYLVADGMGGHQAGEVASDLAVSSVHDFLSKHETSAPVAAADHRSPSAARLLAGIRWSNQVVHQESLSRSDRQGMGSTLAAVYLAEDRLIAANIGDSPIYLVRNGGIDALSVPHTLQAEIQSEACDPFFGNVLTRALGPKPAVDADLCEIDFYRNDLLLLCSDGLSNKVSPPEILSIVGVRPAREACRTLVEMANVRGGEDNISVIIVRIADVRRNGHTLLGRWFNRLRAVLSEKKADDRPRGGWLGCAAVGRKGKSTSVLQSWRAHRIRFENT